MPDNPNVPKHTYYAHEDLIGVNEGDMSTHVMQRTPESLAQLQRNGYAEHFQGVPFTGGDQDQRESNTWHEIQRDMIFNTASREAGLVALDTRNMVDEHGRDNEALEELRRIGLISTDAGSGPLLGNRGNVLVVSEGHLLNPTDDEAIKQRADNIGSFAHIKIPMGNESHIPGIAYTDQCGNETIAPASPTLGKLLDDLGYREVEQPTFNTDILSPDHPTAPKFGQGNKVRDFLWNNQRYLTSR